MTAPAVDTPEVSSDRMSKRPAHLWKPGQSGNPGGKPRGVAELRRKLLRLEPKARKRLMELIESANEEVAFKALALYFAYVLGKPPENMDLVKMEVMRERVRSVMGTFVKTETLPAQELPPIPVEEVAPSREAVPLAPTLTSSAPPEAPREVRVSGEPSGLRCLYRGKDGQCQELAAEGASWCLPHKTKLFSMVNE